MAQGEQITWPLVNSALGRSKEEENTTRGRKRWGRERRLTIGVVRRCKTPFLSSIRTQTTGRFLNSCATFRRITCVRAQIRASSRRFSCIVVSSDGHCDGDRELPGHECHRSSSGGRSRCLFGSQSRYPVETDDVPRRTKRTGSDQQHDGRLSWAGAQCDRRNASYGRELATCCEGALWGRARETLGAAVLQGIWRWHVHWCHCSWWQCWYDGDVYTWWQSARYEVSN